MKLIDLQASHDHASVQMNKCRCGRGRNAMNNERANCTHSTHYSSRCPCLKAKLSCTENCKCLNCGNGNDTIKPDKDVQLSEKRRKRPRHVEQEFIKQEGWKFMKNQNEQTISGLWTKHEHYIFVASVDALRKTNKELNAQDILELYKSIQQIIERDGINVVLSNKTHSQVNCKLSQYKKEDNAQQTCGKINYLP